MELLKLLLQITSVAMEIHQLAFACKFQHIISLPRIAKNIVKNATKTRCKRSIDDWMNTPTVDMATSLSRRLMSRKTRHSLPMSPEFLQLNLWLMLQTSLRDKRKRSTLIEPLRTTGQNEINYCPREEMNLWNVCGHHRKAIILSWGQQQTISQKPQRSSATTEPLTQPLT